MKNYLITVERKQITTMIVNGGNQEDAINKVNDVMINCEKNKSSLEKIFDQGSFFKYKVELVEESKPMLNILKIK